MDNRLKSLGINTILVFIGKLGSGLITFLMLPIYTRWLTPDAFGLAELINTYSNILLSIATCCMADAIFIYPKTSDEDGKRKYFSSGLIVAACGMLVSFLVASILAKDYFADLGSIHTNSYKIILLSSCMFLQTYTQQFTRSIDKMKVYSISGIVQSFSVALFAFLFIPRFGYSGYIYSLALANVAAAVYTIIGSRSYKYISVKYIDHVYAKELLKYGVPLIPNSVMWWLVDGINKPIMEAQIGLSAIGIYAIASKFPSVLNIITGAFSNAWGISVSEEYGKKDFNDYFNQIFKLVFFVLILFSMLITMLSDTIIDIFTSSKYAEAAQLLPILLLSVVLANGSGMLGGIFMARKQSKYFFYSSIYGAIASLIFTFLLIEPFGIYGVAWASVISFLVMLLTRGFFVWKDISNIKIFYYLTSLLVYIVFVFVKQYFNGLNLYLILSTIIIVYLFINKQMVFKIYKQVKVKIKR